ncbi:Hypothetical protein NTJ_05310 [Nesidiocoris tenuis]|uniref:Uncharacterized protein n=1 Tax=Nesidiocoris tenuis TaxID=355587 RepID=A0ABN7AJS3_9HEMI|nr:Hypothetical protein NTJ_05310 [Nesidiocoris tenuis]
MVDEKIGQSESSCRLGVSIRIRLRTDPVLAHIRRTQVSGQQISTESRALAIRLGWLGRGYGVQARMAGSPPPRGLHPLADSLAILFAG